MARICRVLAKILPGLANSRILSRRNEIAIPVREPGVEVGSADLETEWGGESSADGELDEEPAMTEASGGADIDDIGPSDVEDGSP